MIRFLGLLATLESCRLNSSCGPTSVPYSDDKTAPRVGRDAPGPPTMEVSLPTFTLLFLCRRRAQIRLKPNAFVPSGLKIQGAFPPERLSTSGLNCKCERNARIEVALTEGAGLHLVRSG
jgi:hypothetical protein